MSGLWRTSEDGRLTGRSSGNTKSSRLNSGSEASPGATPLRTASRFRVRESSFSSGGMDARVLASCVCCARISGRDAPPNSS